jgi:hypothetical protein
MLQKLKKPKSVTQNVEGALVKGKAWNICQSRTESLFSHGFNKLHAVIRGALLKERLYIATGMGSEDSPPLMAGSATVCEETYWNNENACN